MSSDTNHYFTQGQDYETEVDVQGIDLTNATIISQIRRGPASTIAYPFEIDFVDAPNGKLRFVLSAAVTASMKDGRYVYDAFYTLNGKTIPFLSGIVTVYPRISRP